MVVLGVGLAGLAGCGGGGSSDPDPLPPPTLEIRTGLDGAATGRQGAPGAPATGSGS